MHTGATNERVNVDTNAGEGDCNLPRSVGFPLLPIEVNAAISDVGVRVGARVDSIYEML